MEEVRVMPESIMGVYFVRSQNEKAFYDTDIDALMKRGFSAVNRGPNYTRMAKPCQVYICIEHSDGKVEKREIRRELCRYYHVQLLKKERFDKFVVELYTGKVHLVTFLAPYEGDPRTYEVRYELRRPSK